MNGTLAHSLDFDDTHLPSVLHPSSSAVPAALAVAEAEGRSGAELLAAIAAADEVCVRVGSAGFDPATGVNLFFERGLHATSICGALGAATAAAMLYGLDADGIGHAIAIAASMGAGLLEANRTGGTVKRVHCGWAAHAGIAAAEARAGRLDRPAHGDRGPLRLPPGVRRRRRRRRGGHTRARGGMGAPGIFFKPYPCNHFTHPAVDAALRLRAAGLDPAAVEEVVLGVPSPVLRTIGLPPEEKARPRSGYHAQFSGPFVVASALLGGGGLGLWLDDFTDERAHDPQRLALAAKVRCEPDAECDAIFPRRFPARLRVRLAGGEEREEFVPSSRGGAESPLSDDELEPEVPPERGPGALPGAGRGAARGGRRPRGRRRASGRSSRPRRSREPCTGSSSSAVGSRGSTSSAASHAHRSSVTLVDRRNYHLFQPLLYQVATGILSPGEIAPPLRGILRRQRNVTVLLAEVAASTSTAAW